MELLNKATDTFRAKPLGDLDDLICEITDAGRMRSAVVDWDSIVLVVEKVKSLHTSKPHELADLLRRRLKAGDPRSTYLALVLLESLCKNLGPDFLSLCGETGVPSCLREVTAEAVRVSKSGGKGASAWREAAEKGLELMQCLGEELLPYRSSLPSLAPWVETYHAMRVAGCSFPYGQGEEAGRPKVLDAGTIAQLDKEAAEASTAVHKSPAGGRSRAASGAAGPGSRPASAGVGRAQAQAQGAAGSAGRGRSATGGSAGAGSNSLQEAVEALSTLEEIAEASGVPLSTSGAGARDEALRTFARSEVVAILVASLQGKQAEVQSAVEAALTGGADAGSLDALLSLNDRLATILGLWDKGRKVRKETRASAGAEQAAVAAPAAVATPVASKPPTSRGSSEKKESSTPAVRMESLSSSGVSPGGSGGKGGASGAGGLVGALPGLLGSVSLGFSSLTGSGGRSKGKGTVKLEEDGEQRYRDEEEDRKQGAGIEMAVTHSTASVRRTSNTGRTGLLGAAEAAHIDLLDFAAPSAAGAPSAGRAGDRAQPAASADDFDPFGAGFPQPQTKAVAATMDDFDPFSVPSRSKAGSTLSALGAVSLGGGMSASTGSASAGMAATSMAAPSVASQPVRRLAPPRAAPVEDYIPSSSSAAPGSSAPTRSQAVSKDELADLFGTAPAHGPAQAQSTATLADPFASLGGYSAGKQGSSHNPFG